MYAEEKILLKIADVVKCTGPLEDAAYDMVDSMTDVISTYRALSHDAPYLIDTSAALDFEMDMKYIDVCVAQLHTDVAKFDKLLAKLIELRVQLAEATDIPLMSHLTGGSWTRSEEHVM
jgi:hypothetical protein